MDGESSIRVLLVDDDPGVAGLVAEYLEREDTRITVETEPSASKGLERFAPEAFDCIISDYDMPDQNGIDFLETVREEYPDFPFILFTGRGSEEVASEAISADVTDYLQKTTETSQYAVLANKVQNAVERYRGQQARSRQRKAIETAHEGIAILDQEGHFLYVNQAYADLYGYDPDAMIGESWDLIYPDDEVAFAQNEILPTVSEEGVWYGVTTGLRSDDTTFLEDHTVTKTDAGELICSVRDRSEEKQRETDLIRFRTLVETLDDPVYVLDETGQFDYVNDAFVEMVGYDRETILGSGPGLIKSDTEVEQAEAKLGGILSSEGPDSVQFEVEIQPADDEPILCEDHMGVLPYEGEEFDGSVGILRDITERTRRKRKLERYNERLEQFTSVVSHDLRNPLNLATGRLELAQAECDSEHLDEVAQAHEQMETLIDDLLTLAREGVQGIETEPVSLARVSNACWQTVETVDATLTVEDDLTIQADSERLKELLGNLLRNAIEHAGDEVSVTVGELADRSGFYVADDGPGIPADERESVFEAGHSTADGGTGFGLNIVQEIAESHGWEVRVTDSESGGARFEISNVDLVE